MAMGDLRSWAQSSLAQIARRRGDWCAWLATMR